MGADDGSRELLRAGVGDQDANAVGVAAGDEVDAAVRMRRRAAATMFDGACHVSQLGIVLDSPDEVLESDSLRGVRGPGPAGDQVQLETTRSEQQRRVAIADGDLACKYVAVERWNGQASRRRRRRTLPGLRRSPSILPLRRGGSSSAWCGGPNGLRHRVGGLSVVEGAPPLTVGRGRLSGFGVVQVEGRRLRADPRDRGEVVPRRRASRSPTPASGPSPTGRRSPTSGCLRDL